ncbi:MAG: YfcE family phosphodiesterase, partial [Syntrophomonas sp.]
RKKGLSEEIVEKAGRKFLVVHGHQYGVKRGLNRIFYRGKEAGVDMVVFGHTHVACADKIDGLWLLNPGSPSQPRLPDHASYAIIEADENSLNPVIIRI